MKRITLTPEQRAKFERAAYQVYNSIEQWVDTGNIRADREVIPSKSLYECVVRDQMHINGGLDHEDLALWDSLSDAEQKRIVFAVGP